MHIKKRKSGAVNKFTANPPTSPRQTEIYVRTSSIYPIPAFPRKRET